MGTGLMIAVSFLYKSKNKAEHFKKWPFSEQSNVIQEEMGVKQHRPKLSEPLFGPDLGCGQGLLSC